MSTGYQPIDQEEVTVEDRKRHAVRKRVLLTGVGLVVLGLISGLYAYESVKGRNVNMKRGTESASSQGEREGEAGYPLAGGALPGGRTTRTPLIDEARPGTIETATFAMG